MLRTVSSVPVIASSPTKPEFDLANKDEMETNNKQDQAKSETQNSTILFNLNKKSLKNKRKKSTAQSSDDDEENDEQTNFAQNEDAGFIEEDEERLENLVFGNEKSIMQNMNKLQKRNHSNKKEGLKFNQSAQDVTKTNETTQIANAFSTRKPAWQDDNDEEEKSLPENQVNKFIKYYGTPLWADLENKVKRKRAKKNKTDANKSENNALSELDDSDSDEESADFFQTTGNFLQNSSKITSSTSSLPRTTLDIKNCTDANKEEPHMARLTCVEFHPSARVMFTAGLNQKLTLFQIDGKKNAKIQSIFIEKFPILSAHFTKQTGDEIIMGSRHKSFYYYDMNSGKIIGVTPPVKALEEYHRPSISSNFEISPDNRFIAFIGSQGQIHLFSCKSKEWINTIKINDSCNAVTFSPDARYLFAFGDDKDVHVFDLNDRGQRSLYKFTDYGCLSGTSIAVSNNSQFIATGCKSGVVNIYNLNESLEKNNRNPKPLKSFMNLTTPCTSLKFNSTSEILAACSSYAENACKLIHVGSLSVFSNFPQNISNQTSSTIQSQIRIPQCLDFSLNSGYMAIGNHKGNALLYRLKHYGSF